MAHWQSGYRKLNKYSSDRVACNPRIYESHNSSWCSKFLDSNVLWRWDFARGQRPTLMMDIEDGIFFRSGKLTFDPDKKEYRMIAKRFASTTDRTKLDTLIMRGKSEVDKEDPTVNVLTLNGKLKGGYEIRVTFHNREKHSPVQRRPCSRFDTLPYSLLGSDCLFLSAFLFSSHSL